MPRLALSLALSFSFVIGSSAQTPQPEQTTQGESMLQRSIAALAGATPVNDVTLTGTITVTTPAQRASSTTPASGPTTESGTVTLTALGDTLSQIAIKLPSGTRTKIRNLTNGTPTETSTGPDGIPHYVPPDSLLTPHAAWFFPAFMMTAEVSNSQVRSFAGSETKNGANVAHVAVSAASPGLTGSGMSAFSSELRRHDLYIDPSTSLPLFMDYRARGYPQNKGLIALRPNFVTATIEIRFLNYQMIQSRPVPFRIQVYLKDKLWYDIVVSSVQFNTGAVIPTSQ